VPVVIANTGAASDCGATSEFPHASKEGRETVLTGPGFLAFRAPYRINTDGASNSYHPDDPNATRGLAINRVCHGATSIDAEGRRFDYRQCGRMTALFEQARDAGWPAEGTRVRFYAMATQGRNTQPCFQANGAFVSMTSLPADPSRGTCDQARYLDALTVPFVIRPGDTDFTRAGMDAGDLVAVHQPASGRTVFAIVGDAGPSDGLGEGSVALNAALMGRPLPRTYAEVLALQPQDVLTVVLTDAPMDRPFTAERIAAAGQAELDRLGGAPRLAACAAALAR
jgi:hypothetical protein